MCIGVCISAETLYDVVQRPHLRQVLRMLPEQVQQEIYSPTADNNAIRIFTSNNFKMLQGRIETEAVLYIGVHGHSRAWYVGRTSAGRCRGKKAWNGPAVRWMEHFTQTFNRGSRDPARRYRIWRQWAPYMLSFLTIMHGPLERISRAEIHAIRTLQPPTQSNPTGEGQNLRQKRTRPWPSARSRPTTQRECDLNIWKNNKPRNWTSEALSLWGTWDELVCYAKRNWKMQEDRLIKRAFEPGCMSLMVLLCASGRHLFPWKYVWRLTNPCESRCRLWCLPGHTS